MGMRANHHDHHDHDHHRHRRQVSSSSSIDSNTNDQYDINQDHHGRRYHRGDHDYDEISNSLASACSRSCDQSSAKDLSTDLRLGLSICTLSADRYDLSSSSSPASSSRGQYSDWPPIKPLLRSTLAEKPNIDINRGDHNTLFVKVYMEGIPIGRKLDLLAHHGYHNMITTLSQMFKTTILYPDATVHQFSYEKCHVLTYEDKEGDWMMVGDVPWEMFLSTVKRLKITTMDKC